MLKFNLIFKVFKTIQMCSSLSYLIKEALARVPKRFLGKYGVGNSDGAIQGIVDECRRANFLHLAPR